MHQEALQVHLQRILSGNKNAKAIILSKDDIWVVEMHQIYAPTLAIGQRLYYCCVAYGNAHSIQPQQL